MHHRRLSRRAPGTLLIPVAAALLLASACEKDPFEAQTWIDKLDNPAELDNAVRRLEQLKDPKAIPPLGKLWLKMNKPTKVLRAIINIASATDKGGKTHYAEALPFVTKAVEEFDPSAERSIDDAVVSCDILGKAADPSTLDLLVRTATKPMPKNSPANRVRIAAMRALGSFHEPRAADTLIKILSASPEEQRLQLHAAAANALAETGDPRALPTLTKALIEIGPLFQQIRGAITRIGPQAIPAMTALYQEKDPVINKLAAAKDFGKKAPGLMIFKGALMLGDLRAKEATPLLVAGLKTESKVSYFDEKTGAPGPPTHMAILDALQRIGDPTTFKTVWGYAIDPKTDDAIRPRAIDVASWLAPAPGDVDMRRKLLSWICDDDADPQVRFSSMIAYGRVAPTDAPVGDVECKNLEKKGKSSVSIKKLVAYWDGRIKTFEEKIKNAKSDGEKAGAEADKEYATGYRDALVETGNRIAIAEECKGDAACFAKALTANDVAMGKPGMAKAERALVELYKMGANGKPGLDLLLKSVDTSERIVREGILLALPRVAPAPCDQCTKRLDEVMTAQAQQTTLDALNLETRVVYHYYLQGKRAAAAK